MARAYAGHTDRSNAGTTATYNHSQELPDVLGQPGEDLPGQVVADPATLGP